MPTDNKNATAWADNSATCGIA